jgi:hypothetical protein
MLHCRLAAILNKKTVFRPQMRLVTKWSIQGGAGGENGWILQKDKSLRQRRRPDLRGPAEEFPAATMAYFVYVP